MAEIRHPVFSAMVGSWKGTAKTWFRPNELADESPISGTVRSILDGRFLLYEYRGTLQGQSMIGMAILGIHQPQMAWVDTAHMGNAIMFSEGKGAGPCSVLGSYAAGTERWGWRTEYRLVDADHWVLTHFNITPQGQEAKAVEIQYARE
jgi:hypothetical protein